MSRQVRAFVAYPSAAISRSESIEEAIRAIQGGEIVDIIGWKELSVGGRLIIGAVCDEIRKRELFIADVTGLNPNVLFELGYAIAHQKRIWLLFDPNIEKAKADFERFQLLTTLGYHAYTNSNDIVQGFYKEQPYLNLEATAYQDLNAPARPLKKPTLLYLKCDIDTEASIRVTRRVASGPLLPIIDDPKEVRVQPLNWYLQQVNSAFAVVTHFLSNEYQNWQLHNTKHALVAGLAHGMGKPTLMLAHEPYISPLDYRDLLRPHRTAAAAEAIFTDWLLPLIDSYEKKVAEQILYQEEEKVKGELWSIAIGDPVAEFESDELLDYFVPTTAYTEALRSKHSIFVGRKGSGKTASLYKLAEEIGSDPRNHICVVKPVDYELEGLIDMLSQHLARSEKGYLIESFWKYLIYTELTKSIYDQILSKPPYYQKSEAERELFEFVDENQAIITPEFSVRLETAVAHLRKLTELTSAEIQRAKISEQLHSNMLPRLRTLLGRALAGKARVAILVDNLDKAWNQDANFELLSELLFGLLSVSSRISQEFQKEDYWRKSVDLSLTLFLRSDIHAAIIRYARERDKLPVRRMTWDEPEQLRRVVQVRFVKSGADVVRPAQIWERYFTKQVRGTPLFEYLSEVVLPRPRDLIYLVKTALQLAVNRGHLKIEEKDLISAEQQYSRFALDSLFVETGSRISKMEDLVYEFAGMSEIITTNQIKTAMDMAGLAAASLNEVIDTLAELTFLGLETGTNRFEYMYDEDSKAKLQVMARKLVPDQSFGLQRFRINRAFHAYLEIKPHDSQRPDQLRMELPNGEDMPAAE
jgi:hypothetical protein